MASKSPALLPWRLVLAIATLLGCFSAFLSYTFMMEEDKRSLFHAASLNLVYWYAWALMAQPIVFLARRVRFERGAWPRALAVHVPASMVASLLHVLAVVSARNVLLASSGMSMESWSWSVQVRRTFASTVDWEMMTYWVIVGAALAVEYYREAQERTLRASRLETALAQAQLQTLQRQLHPHFLFNTLHAISTLMHKDVEAADRMVVRLSDLLRQSLERVGHQEIPLQEELAFLRKYVEIEAIRFRDRLTVRWDVAPDVVTAVVPSFILQPLVENAIVHGIGPIGRHGVITVAARREGEMLWMEVRDNGAGLAPDALVASRHRVGLSNTRSRLEHMYGARFRFEFYREGNEGLSVRVVIPFKQAVPSPQQEVA